MDRQELFARLDFDHDFAVDDKIHSKPGVDADISVSYGHRHLACD
jgi:hypothetical protein